MRKYCYLLQYCDEISVECEQLRKKLCRNYLSLAEIERKFLRLKSVPCRVGLRIKCCLLKYIVHICTVMSGNCAWLQCI